MLDGEPIGVRFPPRLAPKTMPQPKALREIFNIFEICFITGIKVKVIGILSTTEDAKPHIHIFKIGTILGWKLKNPMIFWAKMFKTPLLSNPPTIM